jgi:F-type H+-transporting ATPase subunit gamma
VYENDDDATKDLAEFSLANAIYAALVEGHACEQSARYDSLFIMLSFLSLLKPVLFSQTAMDNASKNAKDMIGSLQMKYNRGRQAAITNELVDIITGTFKFSPCFPISVYPFSTYIALQFFWNWDF